MDFTPYIQRYENELINEVIPFWEDHCVDHEFGGYFTSLDRDGSVYDTEKYMWMQWRIVYMFAKFAVEQGGNDRWLAIAAQGYD
ncbi:MAG: AGE family epimerase/isomerase, partial [Lentisphaeria bacterium]|nr:AGE family epimerase/isomerase [Lentisphaeria bacterium]